MQEHIEIRPQDVLKNSKYRGAERWLVWLKEGNFFVDLPDDCEEEAILILKGIPPTLKKIHLLEVERNNIKKSDIFRVAGIPAWLIWTALFVFALLWNLTNYPIALAICSLLCLPLGVGGLLYVRKQDRKREAEIIVVQKQIDALYTEMITGLERLSSWNFAFGWNKRVLYCFPMRDKLIHEIDDRINPHEPNKKLIKLKEIDQLITDCRLHPPKGLIQFNDDK